jgi:indole-3-glycerol phosphate synthase
LQGAGIDGILVGEHLLRKSDLQVAVRELMATP